MASFARPASLLIASFAIGGTVVAAPNKDHPRLYVDAAGLDRLRRLCGIESAPNGAAPAAAWQAILARARTLAEGPAFHYQVRIPAPNHEHDGWDWSYTLSPEPPPRHDESRHYPPWTAMFQERSDSITTRLKLFSLAWLVTGEELFYQKAHEIAFCLAAWPQWTDPSYGSLPSCLDTGHCTQVVALFYDWCFDRLTPTERETLREALVSKGIEPIAATFAKLDPYHNFWAVINTGFGVAALALAGEEPRADEWIAQAIANAAANFDRQGADGGSYEGPMYGTYAADETAKLIFALDSSGTPHALREHPFLDSLPRFAVNGLSPHVHGIPTFGDGGFSAGYLLTMAVLASAGDEDARYYLETAGLARGLAGPNELLFLAPLLERADPPAAPTWLGSDAFVDIGYAFLRARDPAEPFLAFKCGPPNEAVGHNHYDQGSFQITFAGAVVAADPGYRSYFNPPARRYTSSTLGHNTLVVDFDDSYLESDAVVTPGRDQVSLVGGRIDELFVSSGYAFVAGDSAAAYNRPEQTVLDRFRRRILYLPPNAYVIRDELSAPAAHRYGWLLHGVADASAWADGDRLRLTADAALDGALYTPGGLAWRTERYPGAEGYGPYIAAINAAPAAATTFTAALVPREVPPGIANGGFEDGLARWRIRNADGQGPNHSVSTEHAHSGARSGRIAGAGYFYSNDFALPPGTRYTIRAWTLTDGATNGGELVVYYWRAGSSFASERLPRRRSEGEWSELVLEGTVPEGCERICVALNYFDTGVGYFDDVSLTCDVQPERTAPPEITPLGEGAAAGVTVAVDGWRHLVVFGSAGGIDTDGAWAAVSLAPDGRLARALLVGGTSLGFEGRERIHTARPCTVAVEFGTPPEAAVRVDLAPHAEPVSAEAVGLVVSP